MSTVGQNVAVRGSTPEAATVRQGTHLTTSAPSSPLNPCELEIDLFCKGMCVDRTCARAGRALHFAHARRLGQRVGDYHSGSA